MSVPTAVGADPLITATRKGVMRTLTKSPKRVGVGSMPLRQVELPDRPQVTEILEHGYNPAGALLGLLLICLDVELRGVRRLVRIGDAGELLDLTGKSRL